MELDVRHLVRGMVRRGLKPVPPKASIALRVDADVLEWFKAPGVRGIKLESTQCCARSGILCSNFQ